LDRSRSTRGRPDRSRLGRHLHGARGTWAGASLGGWSRDWNGCRDRRSRSDTESHRLGCRLSGGRRLPLHGRYGRAGQIRANDFRRGAEGDKGRDGVPGHHQQGLKPTEEGQREEGTDQERSAPMHEERPSRRSRRRVAHRPRLPSELLPPCFPLAVQMLHVSGLRGEVAPAPCGAFRGQGVG
jgi:hypothetical protein